MISLLQDYGYSMELIPDWDGMQAKSPLNEFCGMVKNPDISIFNPSLYVDPASFNATTIPLPAPNNTTLFHTEDNLSIKTSTPIMSSKGMTMDTTMVPLPHSTLSPLSNGPMTRNSPTVMPIQGAVKRVTPAPLPPSGSSSTIECSKNLFILGWVSMV